MRQREPRLIVAFHTTADAMAMEKYCRAAGISGRLMPVPRSVTADCGIAWCAAPEARDALEQIITLQGMDVVGLFTVTC